VDGDAKKEEGPKSEKGRAEGTPETENLKSCHDAKGGRWIKAKGFILEEKETLGKKKKRREKY